MHDYSLTGYLEQLRVSTNDITKIMTQPIGLGRNLISTSSKVFAKKWIGLCTSRWHSRQMRQSKTKPGFRRCRSKTATLIKKALRTGIPMLILKSRQKRSLLIILCWSRPRFLSKILWTRDPLNKPLNLRERSIYLPRASSWLINEEKKYNRSNLPTMKKLSPLETLP